MKFRSNQILCILYGPVGKIINGTWIYIENLIVQRSYEQDRRYIAYNPVRSVALTSRPEPRRVPIKRAYEGRGISQADPIKTIQNQQRFKLSTSL